MSRLLPRLRPTLDFMPSPVEDRPGLFMRDPLRYSNAMIIVPPVLVECLELFDGSHTDLDLRAELVRITGQLDVSEIEQHLTEVLSSSGFLEDETFSGMQAEKRRAFAELDRRMPVHAGSGYPDTLEELRETMRRYMGTESTVGSRVVGIAAPHVSPEGGWQSYQAAYRALRPEDRDRTFVILGTSHYGESEHFGLTRKPFVTPIGETRVETALVDELADAADGAVHMEDYCHAVEHSIEFQVVFLQHLYGPDIRIVPVLCGSYARSIYLGGGKPETDDGVRCFLDALGEIASREGDRLLWVLGIDMAHIGRRYGDPWSVRAGQGRMCEIEERDRKRVERLAAGDAEGFWALVQENRDDLKWCGSSPLYTFMRAVPGARGSLLRYEQWNIDQQSVVSFAGMSFHRD